jgi:parallel beta-helix repeat protein
MMTTVPSGKKLPGYVSGSIPLKNEEKTMTQPRTPIAKLLLLFTVLLTLTGSLSAVTINVPGDSATIQGAIDGASNGDTVQVAAGTYIENINFNGKNISVIGAGPGLSIIDGGGSGSVVTCDSGETSTTVLDGFTITNGSFYNGGGMSNVSSSPTVTNCTFSENTANYGGGMRNYNSNPTATNCTFSGNTADDGGGGMYNVVSSSPTVTNCTFSGNTADDGGGMYNVVSSSPTVINCTFSGNTAGDGGGMFNYSSSPTVTNCTFSGNSVFDFGGGMYNSSSSPTVTNCILWGDSPDEISNDSSSTLTLSFCNLQGGLSGGTIDGGGNIYVDPLFVDADGPDNTLGTEDDNLRLSSGSPCIDAGSNAAVSAGVTTDLDLVGPRIVNCVVDLGAYEFNGAALGDNVSDECDLCLGDDTSGDSDGDGICDNLDVCSGFDDNLDADGDNVPDDCDLCPGFDDNGPDADSDGVPFGCDRCQGFDDNGPDSDNDGEPDACDTCTLPGDINCDGFVNLLDQALLALHWLETN